MGKKIKKSKSVLGVWNTEQKEDRLLCILSSLVSSSVLSGNLYF